MLICPFTSNKLIGPFLDAYRGLVLVHLVYDFAQFHNPLYKSSWSFRDQFWVLENQPCTPQNMVIPVITSRVARLFEGQPVENEKSMVSMNFSDGSNHTLYNKYFVLQII